MNWPVAGGRTSSSRRSGQSHLERPPDFATRDRQRSRPFFRILARTKAPISGCRDGARCWRSASGFHAWRCRPPAAHPKSRNPALLSNRTVTRAHAKPMGAAGQPALRQEERSTGASAIARLIARPDWSAPAPALRGDEPHTAYKEARPSPESGRSELRRRPAEPALGGYITVVPTQRLFCTFAVVLDAGAARSSAGRWPSSGLTDLVLDALEWASASAVRTSSSSQATSQPV